MVTLPRSAWAILAVWSKLIVKRIAHIIWAALVALPLFLNGQEESTLSGRDRQKFDQYFFNAQRYKQIERYDEALENFKACFKLDNNNATVAYEIGRISRKLKQHEQALTHLQKAYELDPTNRWIALDLAEYYKELGIYEQATTIYERLVEQDPTRVGDHYELAQLYYGQNRLADCLTELNAIEVLVGINEELSSQKKDIYLMLDDVESAEQEMTKLTMAFPANLEYKGLLAQFYTANEKYPEAIALYREMIEADPDDPRAHLDLANLYRQQEVFDSSYHHLKIALANPALDVDRKVQVILSILQLSGRDTVMQHMGLELLNISIEANPSEPKLYALQGDFYAQTAQYVDARNSYRKATRLGANQLQVWSQLLLLDAQIGENDSLTTDSEAFIELYPNQPLGYLMAGSGYLQKEEYARSIEMLEMGLDFVIDNPELEEQFYIFLADAYHRDEQHPKSDAYFDKALEINPRNPTVLNNYAYYLSVRGVRLQEALEMTAQSNTLSPNNGVFLDTWAWVLYKLGKYDQALEKMERCARYGGATSGEVLEHWGDILFKLGRIEEAVAKWKEAADRPDASDKINQKISSQQLYE
jgi:tetratricopeptide (TPR) repeat protein